MTEEERKKAEAKKKKGLKKGKLRSKHIYGSKHHIKPIDAMWLDALNEAEIKKLGF